MLTPDPTINDFRVGAETPEFKRFLIRTVEDGKREVEDVRTEQDYLRTKYLNKHPQDFFGQAKTNIDIGRRLFRSGIVKKEINQKAAILTKGKPKPHITTIFKEEGFAGLAQSLEQQQVDPWFVQETARLGSIGNSVTHLLRRDFDTWWMRSGIKRTNYVVARDCLIDGISWVLLRYASNDKDIVAESVRDCNIIADMSASCSRDRKYVLLLQARNVEDLENKYDLEPGTIEPDLDLAVPFDGNVHQPDVAPKLQRSTVRKVLFIQGFFKDTEYLDKDGDGQGGRIVKFCMDANAENGVRIFEDGPNDLPSFPLIDLIMDPDTEVTGLSVASDIACHQEIADRVGQQGLLNYEMAGVPKMIIDANGVHNKSTISNKILEIIEVDDFNSVQYVAPLLVTQEAQQLLAMVSSSAQRIVGNTDLLAGHTGARVDSAKALVQAGEFGTTVVEPSRRNYEDFIARYSELWFAMRLKKSAVGDTIITDEQNKVSRKMPFAMGDVVESVLVSIQEDSTVPKDQLTQSNLMATAMQYTASDGKPFVTAEMWANAVDLEDREMYLTQRNETIGLVKENEELKKGMEELTAQAQQLQAALQQSMAEKEAIDADMKSQAVASATELQKAQMNNEASITRVGMIEDNKALMKAAELTTANSDGDEPAEK